MNAKIRAVVFFVSIFPFLSDCLCRADQIALQFTAGQSNGVLTLHSMLGLPVSSMYPIYTVLQSSNLETWGPAVAPFSGSVGVSDEVLSAAVPVEGNTEFYRVGANINLASFDTNEGDAVFGCPQARFIRTALSFWRDSPRR